MTDANYWALVPAAGIGRRMGADRPKQYLSLLGRTVIEHTLACLCTYPRIQGVVVCVSTHDVYWAEASSTFEKLVDTATGGAERAHSVLNGLRTLSGHAHKQDWVLVHDAVRPCLRHADIDALIAGVGERNAGGILGTPITETVKRADPEGRILETVPREGLWRALTPQMFRISALTAALERALEDGVPVTDEASAMEHSGGRPVVVPGHNDNIKVTVSDDLALAELYLKRQQAAVNP